MKTRTILESKRLSNSKSNGIIFKAPNDDHLADGVYRAEIIIANMQLQADGGFRLFVAFETQCGKRFTKLFPKELIPYWPFEIWLSTYADAETLENPEKLVGTLVQFTIVNNGRFSNFEEFDFADDDNTDE